VIYENSEGNNEFRISIADPAGLSFFYTKGGVIDIDSGLDITTGEWWWLGVTYKTSTGAIKWYTRKVGTSTVNTATATNTSGMISGGGGTLGNIGKLTFCCGFYWGGSIGMTAIWQSQLTDQNMNNLMLSDNLRMCLQIDPANLKECWVLDEIPTGSTSTGTAYDIGPNRVNGTYTNSPTGAGASVTNYP